MKKVFDSLGQWFLKYKKRLIYGVIVLFIGQICFFGVKGFGVENYVFAADGQTEKQTTAENKLKEWAETLSFVNKTIYVLIYPMLVLAGKLVDNSLVYGEVFGFDAVLWKLWNIVKNLANFTLGFIFLFKIFKYLIDGKEKIKDIILKALIAGIGIQASWFIMATLVDVSTILTYGVGGLPITMLKDSSNFAEQLEQERTKYNPYVLKNVVSLDATNSDEFYIYQTNILGTGEFEKEGNFYISECRTITYGDTGHSEDLILAPKIIYYQTSTGNFVATDVKRCHYYGQVYYFKELSDKIVKDEKGRFPNGGENFQNCGNECTNKQNEYKAMLNEAGNYYIGSGKEEVKNLITEGKILEIGDAHKEGGIFGSVFIDIPVYGEDQHRGLDVDNKWTGEGDKTTKLQGILGGDSYVGVFTALYSSLMERGRNVIPAASNSGMFVKVLNTVLSVGFLLAIGIPLIVVAVVFLMRIGILWVAISLSPFIVLLTAFDLFNSKWLGKIKFLEYFKVDNLISIIFSPAIICFAVSLATVLVTIIQDMNVEFDKIQGSSTILGGLVEVSFAGFPMKIAEFINLLLGVAITWFILWTAIEASKLGKLDIISGKYGLKGLAESALGSIPIIPVPGKDGKTEYLGASTVFGLNGQDGIISRMGRQLKSQYDTKDNKAVEELMYPEKSKEKAQTNAKSNRLNEYMNGLDNATIDDQWMSNYKIETTDVLGSGATNFNTLDDAQKEKVIEKINNMTPDKRKKFGEATPSIIISGKTREFKENDKEGKALQKFVKQESESK